MTSLTRWLGPALVGVALLVIGFWVVRLSGCGKEPSKVEQQARTQVDSLPAWKREAADSQLVLDSLLAHIQRVRADSLRFARQIRSLRHRKDSLAGVTALLQANLDSIPPLSDGATASDSVGHWSGIAIGQGHVIRTMADEIAACRQGDLAYEGRTAELEGALSQCQRRAVILEGQRNQAQVRLDRSVGLLDKLVRERQRKFLGFLPRWTRCVVPAAGGGGAGALVDNDNQLRGVLVGGGAALVGCLVS